MIDVMRKSCTAGTETRFQLKSAATRFLVKNFTGGNIDVCAGYTFDSDESIRIAAGMYQVLEINTDPVDLVSAATDTVIIKTVESGIVEVQRVD